MENKAELETLVSSFMPFVSRLIDEGESHIKSVQDCRTHNVIDVSSKNQTQHLNTYKIFVNLKQVPLQFSSCRLAALIFDRFIV